MSENNQNVGRHDPDFDFEPIRGVPAPLPKGETILWRGGPSFKGLALRALHVRKVAIYFGLLMIWRFLSAQADGRTVGASLGYAAGLLPFAVAAIGILSLIAWGYVRTTVYTLTSRRLLIRSGISLPVTLELPLSKIASASLKLFGDGTGDIPIQVERGERVIAAYIWPNMRPWTWNRPQPMLRAVPDAQEAASRLASALEGRASINLGGANAPQPADFSAPLGAHA